MIEQLTTLGVILVVIAGGYLLGVTVTKDEDDAD